MTTPKLTKENATDWRTPDGIRVVSYAGGYTACFDAPFPLVANGVASDSWQVLTDGTIPFGSSTAMVLIYDPLPKPEPFFFTVWRDDRQGNNPRKRHDTEVDAVREAERLSKVYPGVNFFVMKAVWRSQGAVTVNSTGLI